MRLAKYLAHCGVASRRGAEQLIGAGRVRVDGRPIRDPAYAVSEENEVTFDGRTLHGPEARVVYLLHKPLGVLSTARDTHGRTTVLSLLPDDETRRLYPVGRLDGDSSGLILLTNDGELAHRLTHPSFQVPKTYRVKLSGGPLSLSALHRLKEGVRLQDGITAPAHVRRITDSELELTIHEGRNRQVRRMCKAVGYPVKALKRMSFGPLQLRDLPIGEHRRLTETEVKALGELSG
jgi:23S rRNA pseudouridine2605 synthase